MKIADGIEMLEISAEVMGRHSVINPVLIWDDNNLVLVDTGYPGQLELFREAIEKAGQPFEKLNKVIITHQDIDHIGNLLSIVKAVPHEVEVLAHETEKPYIQGDKTPVKLARLEANLESLSPQMKGVYEKFKSGFSTSHTTVDRVLSDGEKLTFGGGITVIFTPGHTPGHICLYLQESKTLIAGDMLGIENGMLVKSRPDINYDEGLNKESVKKLAEYDIEKVICYHGGLYQNNPNARIAELSAEI